jgi:hypothetical protein
MPSPEMLLQRRALAVDEAIESAFENVAALGLRTVFYPWQIVN